MAAPTLTSIAPLSGPPGTAIVCLGAGFDAGAQVACPDLVATTWVSAAELRAAIPADLEGPQGGQISVKVFIRNADLSDSDPLPFSVIYPYPWPALQTWTNIVAVCGEVPAFKRGGRVSDDTLRGWMRSVAQSIAGAMLRRGLSLSPADWQQPDAETALPTPAGVLELLNRYGAAARLAAAIAGDFTQGEWGFAKVLQREYERELAALRDGAYDKLFRPAAATVETGTLVGGGDIAASTGDAAQAFSREQVF